jgi:cytoskeleton protein RodZ
MSIGAELAGARRKAGLTIAEVSQRTRIREAIVRGIERDDFSACGGDFYARGHIRAIARVAGVDPEPLVREYDDAREAVTQETIPVPRTARPGSGVPARPASPGGSPPSGRSAGTAPGRPAGTAPGRPAAAAPGRVAAAPGGPATAVPGGPATAVPGRPATAAAGRTITVSTGHEMPGRPGPAAQPRRGAPRVPIWGTVLVALLAAAGGVLVYHAVSPHQAGSPAAIRSSAPASARPVVTPRASAPSPTAAPTPTPTVAPGSVVISLAVTGEPCWAEIMTADGTTVFQGTVPAGTTMSWTEGQAVTLTLGNPGSVTLTVNGQARTGLGVNPVTLDLAPAQ